MDLNNNVLWLIRFNVRMIAYYANWKDKLKVSYNTDMKRSLKIILFGILMLPIFAFPSGQGMVIGKHLKSVVSADRSTAAIQMDVKRLKQYRDYRFKRSVIIEMDGNRTLTFLPQKFYPGKKENDFTWTGKSRDGKSKMVLSVHDGLLYGTIESLDGTYKLYPGKGYSKLIKINPDKRIPFYMDHIAEPVKKKIDFASSSLKTNTAQQNMTTSPASNIQTDPLIQANVAATTDSNVSVLLYYTQALEDKYGANTEAMILANFDLARNAYIDSNTQINLQLAAIKKVPLGSLLSSADPANLSDLLSKVSSDGYVRYDREKYGADAVAVFSTGDTYCGLGYTPDTTSSNLINAFSAVTIKPASEGGYYCADLSFAHELGHNFGCFHDPDHVSSGAPMYSYAYGYDILNEFGTIMSYDGPLISYFSNPDIIYTNPNTGNTNPIGDMGVGDNAHAIRLNQFKMADNSEQVSEALELNDTVDNYVMMGFLTSLEDRDGSVFWIEGNTQFTVSNTTYSNNPFFINLYNESNHTLVTVFNAASNSMTIARGQYRVVVAFFDDQSGTYYNNISSIDYDINITTQFKSASILTGLISYQIN